MIFNRYISKRLQEGWLAYQLIHNGWLAIFLGGLCYPKMWGLFPFWRETTHLQASKRGGAGQKEEAVHLYPNRFRGAGLMMGNCGIDPTRKSPRDVVSTKNPRKLAGAQQLPNVT